MNVLEKILKEIEERKKAYHMYSKEVDMIAMLDIRQRMRELNCVEKIIRSHMDEVKNDDWIPVEERLPNKNGVYNVTRLVDDAFISDSAYFDGQDTWHNDNRVNHTRPYLTDIVAWQPLPEPYKGGKE